MRRATPKTPPSPKKPPSPPIVAWPKGEPKAARTNILKWHTHHGRHDLPWINTRDYVVAVSEIMMQQTTVAVGRIRFPRFMERFPDWTSLAAASDHEVMSEWEGLGYYARARALHRLAQQVVHDHNGALPQDRAQRLALPGVGPSTASALGAFVWGLREPIWDANVNRVWRRWWGDRWPALSPSAEKAWMLEMAEQAMPTDPSEIRRYTQAVMDLGATVCTSKAPKCGVCPWRTSCRAHALDTPTAWPAAAQSKAPIQVMWKNWVWHVDEHGRIAVMSPKAKGIWQGLWTLPELRPDAEIHADPDSAPAVRLSASGAHRLTHRQISWTITRYSDFNPEADVHAADWTWVTPTEWAALPWPKPLRTWWAGLSEDERELWCAPARPGA